jgi:hypothetical protein
VVDSEATAEQSIQYDSCIYLFNRAPPEEHVPDALSLPSSLFSADAGILVVMAYKSAETPLLTMTKTAAAADRWHSVMGSEGASRAGLRAIRAVDGKEVPSERGVQDGFDGLPRVCVGRLVLGRVKLDVAHHGKNGITSRSRAGSILILFWT